MKPKLNKCLFPECKNLEQTRGLCKTHYLTARILVKIGKTTWKELEDQKKVMAPRPRRDSHVRDWFLSKDIVKKALE